MRRDMARLPLARRPDINDLERPVSLVDLVNRLLIDISEWKSGIVPGFHASDEITCKFRITGLQEQLHDLVDLGVGIQNQQDRLVRIKQPTGPDRQHRRTADIERACYMPPTESQHRPRIDQDSLLFVDSLLERSWLEGRQPVANVPMIFGPLAFNFFMRG